MLMTRRHILGCYILLPFKVNQKVQSEQDTLGRRNYICGRMNIYRELPIHYMTRG